MTLQETTGDTADSFDDDAALMAELDALDAADSDAQDSEQLADTADSDAEEVVEAEETADEAEETAEVTEEATGEVEPEEVTDVDTKLAKRLETIQSAEERSKTQVDEYRQSAQRIIEEKEAELAPRLELAQQFETLKEQARYNLPAVLDVLGIPPEEYDATARLLHSMRPEAMNDPQTRAAAQRAMQQRQQGGELAELRAEIRKLTEAGTARDQAAEQQRQQQATEAFVAKHVDRFAAAVGDDSPLAQRFLASSPEKARQALQKCGDELTDEYGEIPSPADVAKRFESDRRKQLIEFGVDPDAAAKANTKTKPSDAGEKKAAKTLTGNLGTPTRPQKEPQTEEEIDAEIMKGLDELDNL